MTQVEKIKTEIERLKKSLPWGSCASQISMECNCKNEAYNEVLSYVDSLEEEKFERPNIKINDVIEVSSRMKHIDEDLKPIAEFIMDYCSWNLHKDEWNQPTIEVPLFRVLDALMLRGKPYCEG